MNSVICEVCVDSLEGALAAERGGAHRIELCAELQAGGTTPSYGLINRVLERCSLPVFAMIRCRSGDFLYDDSELETMLADVDFAKKAGASGIVFGALAVNGDVDTERTGAVCAEASPLPTTFHRAFDQTSDPWAAARQIVESGCRRLLTSGQEVTAVHGADLIRVLHRGFAEELIVIPGAGVRPENVAALLSKTGCREVHFSGRTERSNAMRRQNHKVSIGREDRDTPPVRFVTDEAVVAATVRNTQG